MSDTPNRLVLMVIEAGFLPIIANFAKKGQKSGNLASFPGANVPPTKP